MSARCQQWEVYAAEESIFSMHGEEMTLAEVQAYVDSLRATTWWEQRCYEILHIEVGPARRGENGVGGWYKDKSAGRIELAPRARNKSTILHEVSHVIADAMHNSTAHDPAFCRVYLELVYRELGSDAYVKLRESFVQHNVEFN